MQKKRVIAASLLLTLVLLVPTVLAHGDTGQEYFENIWFYLAPFIAIVFGAILVHYYETHAKKTNLETAKKVIFWIIVLVTVYVSLTIFYQTININITSWSKGPVHWHADVDIEICGEPYFLPTIEGFRNQVGAELVHTHEDMRIHVEGPVMEPEEASLGNFFDMQGIPFSATEIADKKNGDICPDGKPSKVRMFVNGKENAEFDKYIISPYPDVPPGDLIKITFGAD